VAHDKKKPKETKAPVEPTVEAAATVAAAATVGGSSVKGEILRAYMGKFVRRMLVALGASPDRIHLAMSKMTEGQREMFQAGLIAAPAIAAFLVSKLPLSAFAGFKNPQEAAMTASRFIDELIEEIEEAAESYKGIENVPQEVLDTAANKVLSKVQRLEVQKLRSPIEILAELFEQDPAKKKEWNDWFRSLNTEDRAHLMEFIPYLDSVKEVEGLMKIDAEFRIEHLTFLKNNNEGFQAAKAAKEFAAGVGNFMDKAKVKAKQLDDTILRQAADDLAHALEKRRALDMFGWTILFLSPLAAMVAWFLGTDHITAGWALFGTGGAGLACIIAGALLRKKRATASSLSDGWNFLRVPALAVATVVRWGTDEIGALKRLIILAFTVPFMVVLGASLFNKPYVVFYASLGAVIFAVVVLVTILIDAVIAFAAIGAIGALVKKEGKFSGAAVAAVRDWASSTVAWYTVIFLTFMYVPWASPMAVAVIAASTLFFAAQRLAHWFHSTIGRKFAYGGAILLAAIVLTREVSPAADAYAGTFARTYLGGDLGLKGVEDRILLRSLDDERRIIRERAIAECGQEYCSPADAARDADILRRKTSLVNGTYWDSRNGTPNASDTTNMVLSQDEANDILRDLEAAQAE